MTFVFEAFGLACRNVAVMRGFKISGRGSPGPEETGLDDPAPEVELHVSGRGGVHP